MIVGEDVRFAFCFAEAVCLEEAEMGVPLRGAAGCEQESGFVGSLMKQLGLQLTSLHMIRDVSRSPLPPRNQVVTSYPDVRALLPCAANLSWRCLLDFFQNSGSPLNQILW